MNNSELQQQEIFGLNINTLSAITNVFTRFPEIEKVLLYGSRAKGNFRNGSDIDLTFVGNRLTYQHLSRIETELDDLLLPYTFDVSLFSEIDNDDLIEHIQRVGKIIYTHSDSNFGTLTSSPAGED